MQLKEISKDIKYEIIPVITFNKSKLVWENGHMTVRRNFDIEILL